jgi:hypothetical protein
MLVHMAEGNSVLQKEREPAFWLCAYLSIQFIQVLKLKLSQIFNIPLETWSAGYVLHISPHFCYVTVDYTVSDCTSSYSTDIRTEDCRF